MELHRLPLQSFGDGKSAPREMKPENQKIMVAPSIIKRAIFCATCGKYIGARTRYGRARKKVQIPLKSKKLASSGD